MYKHVIKRKKFGTKETVGFDRCSFQSGSGFDRFASTYVCHVKNHPLQVVLCGAGTCKTGGHGHVTRGHSVTCNIHIVLGFGCRDEIF